MPAQKLEEYLDSHNMVARAKLIGVTDWPDKLSEYALRVFDRMKKDLVASESAQLAESLRHSRRRIAAKFDQLDAEPYGGDVGSNSAGLSS